MAYNPDLYLGSAAHYLRGRPPYSPALLAVLSDELGWDGTGVLLDLGCGPGVLAVQLAPGFADVIALDPDAQMLAEGERHAQMMERTAITWVHDVAESVSQLPIGPVRVATFGQSLHWMRRDLVVESVYDVLEPEGSLVVIGHDDGPRESFGLAHPVVPDEEVRGLIRDALGDAARAGPATAPSSPERHEQVLARSRFGVAREVVAPGAEVTWDVEGVVSMYLSMSYAAPHLFGENLAAFVASLRGLLRAASPSGWFSEFPGDTVALIATKAG